MGFEPATPTTKRPHTYALDHTATGIGFSYTHSIMYRDCQSVPTHFTSVFLQVSVSQTLLIADPFWFPKIAMDPHILAHENMDCPDDRQPKFKIYISELILYS